MEYKQLVSAQFYIINEPFILLRTVKQNFSFVCISVYRIQIVTARNKSVIRYFFDNGGLCQHLIEFVIKNYLFLSRTLFLPFNRILRNLRSILRALRISQPQDSHCFLGYCFICVMRHFFQQIDGQFFVSDDCKADRKVGVVHQCFKNIPVVFVFHRNGEANVRIFVCT